MTNPAVCDDKLGVLLAHAGSPRDDKSLVELINYIVGIYLIQSEKIDHSNIRCLYTCDYPILGYF